MASSNSVPDPREDLEGFTKSLFSGLVGLTKLCNMLPTRDLTFYRTIDNGFAGQLDACSAELLGLGNRLMAFTSPEAARPYENVDDVCTRYHTAVDVVDGLLEKVDTALDELRTGGKPTADRPAGLAQSAPIVTKVKAAGKDRLDYRLIHAQNIARPQLKFKDPIDNSAKTPFVPKLVSKVHAQVPLEPSWITNPEDPTAPPPHPYAHEITHLDYPATLFEAREPLPYHPFDTTTATWVDTADGVTAMLAKLREAPELAVDLEHHSHRSFQGFTCLMQISTRDEDFLVDTLAVREHLQTLNEVFADPQIVKVFHGAESDILWLQRDFGIYVVGLFDTYHASNVLHYAHHSLAYLLDHFCQVTADKRYQLADWRIRPLPAPMAEYARSDTHYLLYIYDCMRNELLTKNGPIETEGRRRIEVTLQRSAETALRTYVKEPYDAEHGDGESGWRHLLHRYSRPLRPQQFAVLRALHAWRDDMARQEDESTRYVLPGHMLLMLANQMPTEAATLIGLCNPTPPLVRMYAAELAALIARIRATNPSAADANGDASSTAASVPAGPSHIRFGGDVASAAIGSTVDPSGTANDLTLLSPEALQRRYSAKVLDPTAAVLDRLNPAVLAGATVGEKPEAGSMATAQCSLLASLSHVRLDRRPTPVTSATSQRVADEIRAHLTLEMPAAAPEADFKEAGEDEEMEEAVEEEEEVAEEEVPSPVNQTKDDTMVIADLVNRERYGIRKVRELDNRTAKPRPEITLDDAPDFLANTFGTTRPREETETQVPAAKRSKVKKQ
ncbi:exosome nuclease subunit [Tieghemiomyces parasiticus]|uniref:Exosome nuclease subunit n=1 Tax=Tieghemiomyces parasiticus TaxID=78921 RepID=A0A9W8AFL7_9FUNG|nr:exosome nuclease subunit [Tieghemiomyces parasiticus]